MSGKWPMAVTTTPHAVICCWFWCRFGITITIWLRHSSRWPERVFMCGCGFALRTLSFCLHLVWAENSDEAIPPEVDKLIYYTVTQLNNFRWSLRPQIPPHNDHFTTHQPQSQPDYIARWSPPPPRVLGVQCTNMYTPLPFRSRGIPPVAISGVSAARYALLLRINKL